MRSGKIALAVLLGAIGWTAKTQAVNAYSHNFEGDTVVTSGPTTGTFIQFNGAATGGSGYQVQLGANGVVTPTLSAGVDSNGTSSSKALFSTADTTAAAQASFFFWQLQNFNIPAVGAGNTASGVQVSYDMSVAGAADTHPWGVELSESNGWKTDISPTIATDGSFTHVSFLLSGGTQTGTFDPTLGMTLQMSTGSGDYGFDSGNSVHLDNVSIDNVVTPEPASLSLLGLGLLPMLRRRR
ncbi:MAG TPA: hypothetical protein VHS31_15740 [Tepidisphaeraceae bacterium]|jgi:MYXO-CTERM domain-containing protein|nr:hypothetical protein [Tepidisphaeraceae bacterium]